MDANHRWQADSHSGHALTNGGRSSAAHKARAEQARRALTGHNAELLARRRLEAQGLELVAANYRCRFGELDLVMRDGASLVFVEVRARNSAVYGAPEASITAKKKRCIMRAARAFVREHPRFGGMMLRFDVVGILTRGPSPRFRWIRNAIQFDGR